MMYMKNTFASWNDHITEELTAYSFFMSFRARKANILSTRLCLLEDI